MRPSVTGEGDDMFCFRILTLPPPSGCFHSNVPLVLSTHQRKRLSPSATLRKTRSSQMMGVEALQLGHASFPGAFSSVEHVTGRFFSSPGPLRFGPPPWRQLLGFAI